MATNNMLNHPVSYLPTFDNIPLWDSNVNLSANNFGFGYTTTVTAAGTTTLTVSSSYWQFFTGSTTQTVQLPVTSTVALGATWEIVNLSSGAVTVQSSGGNTLGVLPANSVMIVTCISNSGTGTASWVYFTNLLDAAVTNDAVLTSNATGQKVWRALTDGQLIIGSSSGAPIAGTLTAGTGVTITNGANSITINATGGGLSWSTVTAATLAAAVNNGYIMNHAATPCVVTLPATAAIGSKIVLRGLAGSGGWTATANTGQTIQFGNQSSTSAGSWSSTDAGDCCDLECIVANTTWVLTNAVSSGLTKA